VADTASDALVSEALGRATLSPTGRWEIMRCARTTTILCTVWIIPALMSFNQPAEALDKAKPKVAEARLLAESAERMFEAVDRNIARRHELVFEELSLDQLSCNGDEHDRLSGCAIEIRHPPKVN
jgi:hypothetical protein